MGRSTARTSVSLESALVQPTKSFRLGWMSEAWVARSSSSSEQSRAGRRFSEKFWDAPELGRSKRAL